jgi:hypothetical protein
VSHRSITPYCGTTTTLQLVLILLFLCLLAACGGGSGSPTGPTVPPTVPPPAPSSSPTAASSFGMQCGIGDPADCEGSGGTPIKWPATQAQPGMLRLHDAGTYWSILNPQSGVYDWSSLDAWLDVIAQHEPVDVIQVFTWTPCWDTNSPGSTCGIAPTAPTGSNGVPSDLTASGSPSFNSFVTNFVQHCSAAGKCVSDIIKYYEMWNEWDLNFHWVGNMNQLYQMLAPAAQIIKTNVPNAIVMSPSSTPAAVGAASNTGLGWQCDFQSWLNLENTNGRFSDWADWHVYLLNTDATTNIPEQQFSTYSAVFVNIQDGGTVQNCSAGPVSGWSTTPWANTETNFGGSSQINFACPTTYSADDCTGQIVRWQLLHASNGGSSVDWYKWNETIGGNPQYETAYYNMMQYMEGGKFTAVCSFTGAGEASTWTCPFTEKSGTSALWVWTPAEAGTTYTVPSGYVDFEDLTGATTTVASGQSIPISVEPILLEQ